MTNADVSIVLPTFNERDNICDLIDAIDKSLSDTPLHWEVLVIDDDSPDGTADVVRDRYVEAGNRQVHLFVRTKEKGLAFAIRYGLERANGETLVVMDTDFNHDPGMIPQMVDFLRYYDLVIGSRFVMGGGMEDQMRYRLSLLYNVFIRLLFQTQIQDNLSGFFAVRRANLEQLQPRFDRIFYGYGDYFIRLLLFAWRNRWRIHEVPVFYILRRHGESKTGFWTVFRDYTIAVLRLRIFGV